ncbi:DUF4197 domain-containing protein [Thiomicrorhabdus sp. zzn3]|uniref:DUF4197 domain-containing protein n=1 Tax=Thiomicrorhabdus sp. zzn3 TaxID=3039775 RepID=UPI002436E9A2|nr:DUF4197 domain-containing protein [Thiomicrorhabdus sp. zzn3]MDG6778752.1 DUF4197 domain-containing protein [Thiomicrorhabdus sp. zzn3]
MRCPKVIPLLMISGLFIYSVPAQSSWWEQGLELITGSKTDSADTHQAESTTTPSLSNTDLNQAFKEALSLGSEEVVKKLSLKDAFNADPNIHIPLPDSLQTVHSWLSKAGMGSLTEDLELKLNRAAEAAAPEAKTLFLNAINNMTFEDVRTIYNGPQDSATRYLQEKTSDDLKEKMRPIIQNTLNQVGAVQAYDRVIENYKSLPFVPDIKANLTEHVSQKGMDGLFYYLAEEEKKIRQDPLKQTTELLKKVFGTTTE